MKIKRSTKTFIKKLISSWLHVLKSLFFSIMKYLIEGFFLFMFVILIYRIVNGIRWDKNTDENIIKKIKRDTPTNNINIKFLKTDLKGFGNDSLVVFTSYPNENWVKDWEQLDYEIEYYPQILIYDKIQKNFLERIIFEGDLYKKVFELQLTRGHEENDNLIGVSPFYALDEAKIITIGDIKLVYFEWTDVNQANNRPILRGLLGFSMEKGFYIKPFFEGINRYEIKDDYNSGQLELFDNIRHNVKINGQLTGVILSLNLSEDYFKFSGDDLLVDYSLFGYNTSNLMESHADCHDRAILRFTKNPYGYLLKDRNLGFNFYKLEEYIHNIEEGCPIIYYSKLY